ncbi:hypothetical protein Avbf_05614 [Armadillidium vulgare]|nr:hypothetical protein Avbf_05614 [Armadillidium vulgare]
MVSLNRNRGRYSVTPILADLLKEPSGCFENFCRLSSLLRLQNIPRKSSYETKNIRDEFAEYFTAVVLPVQWIPNDQIPFCDSENKN